MKALFAIVLAITIFGGLPIGHAGRPILLAQSSSQHSLTFNLRPLGSTPPVALDAIFIGSEKVALGVPVAVPNGWLPQTRILVRNISSKAIVAGTVDLSFTDSGDGSPDKPILVSGANLGRLPGVALRKRDGTTRAMPDSMLRRQEILIQPGAEMEFIVDADQSVAEEKAAGASGRIEVQLVNFYFSDGTKWTGSLYLAPSPAPELWHEIPSNQFFTGVGTR